MDAEGGGVGVGEGEGAGVGHVVARGIVVGGGQLQAVALLAAIALGTPVSQLPCSCERAAQFHVLPVGVALLAVDGDGLAGLPFAHTRQRAVGLEGEALEVSLRVADVLVVPCADHERPVLLVQLHGLFVSLRVGIFSASPDTISFSSARRSAYCDLERKLLCQNRHGCH